MKPINYFLLFFFVSSCIFQKKERALVSLPAPALEIAFTNPSGVFRSFNCTFSKKGATFESTNNLASFIELDAIPKVSGDFNLSLWFKVEGENGKISQTLFKAFNSEKPQEQIRFWVAGNRVTGSLNSNKFYTEDFLKGSSASRTYYDLPRLELGKYYFLSINKRNNQIQVYINAELYAEYNVQKDYTILINSITFGVLNSREPYINQFFGTIRNFEIYEQPLNEDEIYSVSVKHFQEIEPYNDAFELSKFKLQD